MSNEELVKRIQSGNNELMGELYTQCRGYIARLIRRMGIRQGDIDDAMQDAYFGLYEAARMYDGEKGCTFLAYAKYPIMTAIRRGKCSTMHIPEHMRLKAAHIMRLQEKFIKSHGRNPTAVELSKISDFDEKTIQTIITASLPVKSIYEPLGDDEKLTVADVVADTRITFEDDIAAESEAEYIRAVVNELPGRVGVAVRLYYFRGFTYKQIAERLGVSIEYTRQLIRQGLRALRKPKFRLRLIDSELDANTRFYNPRSVQTFKNTFISATEQTVIQREHLRRRLETVFFLW